MSFSPGRVRALPLQAAIVLLTLAGCSSIPMEPQSSSDRYASAYRADQRQIGGHDLSRLTDAKQRTMVTMHFDRPPEEVFEFLLTRVDLYGDSVEEVTFDHSGSGTPGTFGVGSYRLCLFDNGKVLAEPIVVYEPHRFYAYTVDAERSTFNVPVRDVLLFYAFEEQPDGSTLVSVRAHYNAKVGIATPVISSVFNRTIAKTFVRATEHFDGRLVDTSN